jgi:hypothetical protein
MTGDSENNKIKRVYKKNERYKEEQEGVMRKLNEILGINENNNKFILEEIKKNEEKQRLIIGLEEEVKKYFAYTRWVYFNKKVDNKWLSLLKSIYKNTDMYVISKYKMKDGVKYTEYCITKNL